VRGWAVVCSKTIGEVYLDDEKIVIFLCARSAMAHGEALVHDIGGSTTLKLAKQAKSSAYYDPISESSGECRLNKFFWERRAMDGNHDLISQVRDEIGLDAYYLYPDTRRAIPDPVIWGFASACVLKFVEGLGIDFKVFGEQTKILLLDSHESPHF
jgi:hypothetical protein